MSKSYARVQRGQVYWFNPAEVYKESLEFTGFNGRTYKSSVQNFNRPWLVTSNNEGNNSSPTCCIVPITLEDKANIPVHVSFDYEGKRQTILVEQPKTVDCMALGNYMFTVSDSVMEQVEKAIAIQHGIRPQITYADFTLDDTLKHLETMIAGIIESKVEQVKQELQKKQLPEGVIPTSQVEDTALKLGQMIEDLVLEEVKPILQEQPTIQPEVKAEKPNQQPKPVSKPNYRGMSAVEKFNARYNRPKAQKQPQPERKEPVSLAVARPSGKRNTWTNETRLQYLKDCENLSPQEVQKKYGFSSIQSVFQMKYQHRNALIKAGLLESEK